MAIKMTKSEAQKLAKKTIDHSKKYGIPLKRRKQESKSAFGVGLFFCHKLIILSPPQVNALTTNQKPPQT
jgi:hypothetical protein